MIHLGYLAYHQDRQTAYIPNEEIRGEFVDAVEENHWTELQVFEKLSKNLLEATLEKDADRVAKLIEKIHMDYASAIQYNNENSLSSVLTIERQTVSAVSFAIYRQYFTCRNQL